MEKIDLNFLMEKSIKDIVQIATLETWDLSQLELILKIKQCQCLETISLLIFKIMTDTKEKEK